MKTKNYLFIFLLITFILTTSSVCFAKDTNISEFQTTLGGEEYCTIQDNTVTLQQNITLTNNVTLQGISLILDLNGYKITNTASSVQPILTINDSNLTIMDSSNSKAGAIVDASSSLPELITLNSGSLLIKNGYFYSNEKGINSQGGKLIIDNGTFITNNRCILTSDNSTLTINNGAFTSKHSSALDVSGTTSIIQAGNFNGFFSGLEVSSGSVYINSGVFKGDRSVVITGGNVTINNGNFIGIPKSSESIGLFINKGTLYVKSGIFKGFVAGLFINENASVSICGGTYSCIGKSNSFGGIALYQGAKANISSKNMKYNKINTKKTIFSLLKKGYSLNNKTLGQKEVDLYELYEMGANGVKLKENEYYLGYYSISKPYIKVIKSSASQNDDTNTSDSNPAYQLDDTPQTGDTITLYIGLFFASLVGLYILFQSKQQI